ncbi:hypothetical protein GBA52_016167 [Prunus armeniaca]|nr:hypothetical protein GBA52_016167 [Prunus armeniaca]
MENLVTVLLTTLNLPEYPASAPILQVLCVLLLQNAGLKSKDIGARTRAIDLLGTIAARLKHDSALGTPFSFHLHSQQPLQQHQNSKHRPSVVRTTMDLKESVRNQTDVGLRMTRHLFLAEAKGQNMVFSPLSIHVVLSMIAAIQRVQPKTSYSLP